MIEKPRTHDPARTAELRIERAVTDLRRGKIIVVIDDLAPAGCHHLAVSAETISPEDVCALTNLGRGVITAAMWEHDLRELRLPPMGNSAPERTEPPDMMVSIDARHDTTTGISAHDRAATLRLLPITRDMRVDFVMPGHIFPLRAKTGGVLVRTTIAEVCLDLLQQGTTDSAAALSISSTEPTLVPVNSGLNRPVIALNQILNDLGDYSSPAQALALADEHRLSVVYFSDVIGWRLNKLSLVEQIADANLPVRGAGLFRAIVFRSRVDEAEHMALVMGSLEAGAAAHPLLVRVHAENRLADSLGLRTARQSIYGALKHIADEGRGIFIYLRHPRRGFLREQVQALSNSQQPARAMQLREYGVGIQILRALGVKQIRLLTNNKRDIPGLNAFDLEIVERVPYSLAQKPPQDWSLGV